MRLIDDDRIVIERTYRNNEFGDPVVDFESKDYAECVIEELEKIKEIYKKLADESVKNHSKGDYYIGKSTAYGVAISAIEERIAELKGENNG